MGLARTKTKIKVKSMFYYGYIVLEGNTTPSDLIRITGRRLATWDSGGRHPSTSVQRIST